MCSNNMFSSLAYKSIVHLKFFPNYKVNFVTLKVNLVNVRVFYMNNTSIGKTIENVNRTHRNQPIYNFFL